MSADNTILFVSHGGGPLPLLGEPGHQALVRCLKQISGTIQRPERILVVSAHWEEPCATVLSGSKHPLLFDYYGFPEESYGYTYDCEGMPDWAKALKNDLNRADISAALDDTRGYDHGMFVPLMLMYPEADIPCTQLSLLSSLDAADHLQLGKSLQALVPGNTLILGSGFTFHNLDIFRAQDSPEIRNANRSFETWLIETMSNAHLNEGQREQRLIDWEQAPSARFCHPREEHLLPLHVCYGLAGRPCSEHFEVDIFGKQASMYLWTPG